MMSGGELGLNRRLCEGVRVLKMMRVPGLLGGRLGMELRCLRSVIADLQLPGAMCGLRCKNQEVCVVKGSRE